jgi:hypothetical protein
MSLINPSLPFGNLLVKLVVAQRHREKLGVLIPSVCSVTVVQSFIGLQLYPENHDKSDLPQSLRDLRAVQKQRLVVLPLCSL